MILVGEFCKSKQMAHQSLRSQLVLVTPPRLCLETSVNCSWEIGLHLPSVVEQVCLLVLSSSPLG
jgi:hypothetical protein